MTVAVCILNYNGAEYLTKYLPFLINTIYNDAIFIVIDNGSTDTSEAVVNGFNGKIVWLPLKKNNGYAGGYNLGLKQVKADVFVLLNSDVEVTPNWLGPIAALFNSNKTIAAVQPKILQITNRTYFEYAGAAGGYIDMFGYPFCKGRIFDTCEKDNGQYDTPSPIMWASGACLAIRSQAFNLVNGLDSSFFAHMEEVDLCWRLQRAGFSIYSQPAAIVHHVGGGTLPVGSYRKLFLNFRNNHYMLLKNAPITTLLWLMPIRFALDGIAAWQALLFKRDVVFFKAVFFAHMAVFKYLFMPKNNIGFKRAMPNAGFFKGSIVYNYFIKKVKEFSGLSINQ